MSRFPLRCEMILNGHILNPLWLSRPRRREIRERAYGDAIVRYFRKRLIPHISTLADNGVCQDEPERVFSIWFQGEANAPGLIRICFERMRRLSGLDVVVLDEMSLPDWITLPQVIVDKYHKGKILPALFADICRVELLYEHGGYWMDATDYLTAPIPEQISSLDFFVHHTGTQVPCSYAFIQNCMIHARKGSFLLAAWRDMIINFWLDEDSKVDYFMHQLMFKTLVKNNSHAAELYESMPFVSHDASHLAWFEYGDKPYDPKEWERITAGSFWQKTSYRNVRDIIPGSYRAYMVDFNT